MSQDVKDYLEQRLEESTYDLYDTVTSIRRIRFAKFIDISLFSVGMFAFIYLTIQNHVIPNIFVFVSVLLFVLFHFFVKTLLKGQTIGFLIMGIRFVNVHSKQKVSVKEYFNYVKKSTRMEVRYTQIVQYYLSYNGRLNQNQPMRKFGMILVDASRYDKFYKEYSEIKERHQAFLELEA